MPFTLAHPAVVVPLARWFVLPALVVGSMAPDFEYFVYLRPVRTIGHDLIGIPLVCVPSGLLVVWCFENLLKRPMALLLPRAIRLRVLPSCDPLPLVPLSRLLAVLVSIAVGAFSHIAWDSFTHEGGWVVERVPVLSASLGHGVWVYKVLQHGSTLVGLSLLTFWSWRWLSVQAPEAEPEGTGMSDRTRAMVLGTLMAVASGASILVCIGSYDEAPSQGAYAWVVRSVIAFISAFVVASLAYGVVFTALGARAGEAAT
jgi:hypothetical protein